MSFLSIRSVGVVARLLAVGAIVSAGSLCLSGCNSLTEPNYIAITKDKDAPTAPAKGADAKPAAQPGAAQVVPAKGDAAPGGVIKAVEPGAAGAERPKMKAIQAPQVPNQAGACGG